MRRCKLNFTSVEKGIIDIDGYELVPFRLKKLDCYGWCSWQIGDHAFYTVEEHDRVHTLAPKGKTPLVHYLLRADNSHPQIERLVLNINCSQTIATDTADSDSIPVVGVDCTAGGDSVMLTGEAVKPQANDTQVSEQGKKEEGVTKVTVTDSGTTEPINKVTESQQQQQRVEDGDSCDSEYEDEGDDEYQSDTASVGSTHSSASNSSRKKKKFKRKHVSVRMPMKSVKKKKERRAKRALERRRRYEIQPGECVPVEICYTESLVEVMWQVREEVNSITFTLLWPCVSCQALRCMLFVMALYQASFY